MSMDQNSFINDISQSLAVAAHNGTSMTPERRGEHERAEYAQTLQSDYDELWKQADIGGTLDLLSAEFARYRAGYAERYKAYLHSRSRIISVLITGPSNFPGRRNQKRNDIADRRLTELIEFRKRALKAIRNALRPDLRPVMSGDANAIERLQDKARQAEARQEYMKAVNTAHKKFVKNPASLDAMNLPESAKQTIRSYVPAYSREPHPFAPFELTNNNANVRRMKQRLEELTRLKATPETSVESANGITLEDSPADNRVRLFFPGKPSEEIRSKLKSNGFRWTPSLGCWQAYRNYRSIELAKQMAGATSTGNKCGKETLAPDDLIIPCILPSGHSGYCDTGR